MANQPENGEAVDDRILPESMRAWPRRGLQHRGEHRETRPGAWKRRPVREVRRKRTYGQTISMAAIVEQPSACQPSVVRKRRFSLRWSFGRSYARCLG